MSEILAVMAIIAIIWVCILAWKIAKLQEIINWLKWENNNLRLKLGEIGLKETKNERD